MQVTKRSRQTNPDQTKTVPLPYTPMICPVAKLSQDKPLVVWFGMGKLASAFQITGVTFGELLSNLDPFQAAAKIRANTTFISGDMMNQIAFNQASAAETLVAVLEAEGYPTICLRRKTWDVITNAPRSAISAALSMVQTVYPAAR